MKFSYKSILYALKVYYIFIMLYLFIILIFNSTSMYLLNKLYYTFTIIHIF